MRKFVFAVIFLLISVVASAQMTQGSYVPEASCSSVGMSAKGLSQIDTIVLKAISDKIVPGAVVLVVRNGKTVYRKAFGNRQLKPSTSRMTEDTVFDLASLSKSISTSVSIMQLVEQGKVRLDDNVKDYIPDFVPWVNPSNTGEKVDITILNLLTHSSGLNPYVKMSEYLEGHPAHSPEALIEWISTDCPRNFRPGSGNMYSCLNYVMLQAILEKITGVKLCDYARKNIFEVLGMKDTQYCPLSEKLSLDYLFRIAPTEMQSDGQPLRGSVHDPIARLLMNGNSGNAGVFSTADDLAIVCAALLNGGEWHGNRILSPLATMQMFSVPVENGRALGWDFSSRSAAFKGECFNTEHTFCHTGYTGTSIVLAFKEKTAVILLTNRVHPYDKGSLKDVRKAVSEAVAKSIVKR